MNKKEIILGVTGSIAIYKALDLINQLKVKGFNITVIMTKEAQELIRPLSFQVVSENPVYTDMFTPLESKVFPGNKKISLTGPVREIFSNGAGFIPVKDSDINHISLAEKADLILICPATANIIGKIASGICDDLLTCTVISSKARVLICPAMDENMYKNKIVQENITKLKNLGYRFIGPAKGRLACGKIGIGHLAPLKDIIQAVLAELK